MPDYRYEHLIRRDCPLPPGAHVVAYCRDSGGEEQDRSVAQQKEAIAEYCDKHQLILEHTYSDEAKTGSDAERRSGLNQMLSDLAGRFAFIRNLAKRNQYMAKHPFGVLTWKSSRLGRDSIENTHNKADLRLRGLTIVSMIASIETGDPALNAMIESVQQLQDEKLLQEQSDNTKRGLSDVVTLRDNDPAFRSLNPDWPTNDGRYLGIHPGTLPTGFKGEQIAIDMRERKGRLRGGEKHYVQRMIPDRDNGLWERCYLAWQMRHEEKPIKKIMAATRLFKEAGSYSFFFKNRIYTGAREYGGRLLENFVEALIPVEWWQEEQARRVERDAKHQQRSQNPMYEPRRVVSRHLLSGLVYCGATLGEEHPMNADTVPGRKGERARWDFYMCTQRKNSREQKCTAMRVGAAALDKAVIDCLLGDILTVENLRPIADSLASGLNDRNSEINQRISAVQSRLDEVQKALRSLLDAIEKVGLSTSIQTRLQDREGEERKLIAELVNLEDMLVKPKQAARIGEAQLQEWIDTIRQNIVGDDLEAARSCIRQFVAKIVVNQKAGTIYYTFPLSDMTRLRLLVLTGSDTSPRHNTARFTIRRIQREVLPRLPLPSEILLQEKAREMRAGGLSYPIIAKILNVSVGKAWKLIN